MARAKPYQPASKEQIVETLSKLACRAYDGFNVAQITGQAIHSDLAGDEDRWGMKAFIAWLKAAEDNDFARARNPDRPESSWDEDGMFRIKPGKPRPPKTDDEIAAEVEQWARQQWVAYTADRWKVVDCTKKVENATNALAKAKAAKRRAVEEALTTAQKQQERVDHNAKIDEAQRSISIAELELTLAEQVYSFRFSDVIEAARQQELAGKSLITIDPGLPMALIEQVVERLAAPSDSEQVYNVNGELSYIRPRHVPVRYARQGGGFTGTICAYDVNSLSVRIAQQMYFERPSLSGGNMQPCAIDQRTVQEILSRTWPQVPPLRSVGFSPVVTAEGVILDQPRYYGEYGLALRFDPDDYPAISDTEEAAQGAYMWLDREIFDLFDFCDASDRAAAHLMLATAVIHAGFDAIVPLLAIQSVNPMSGKTMLGQTIAAAALGRAPLPTPWKTDDVELGKLITSLLHEAASVVLFDNVRRGDVIESPVIDALTTGGGQRDRILGVSKTDVSDAKPPLTIFTGNGISFGSDTTTRGLTINLNLPERGFESDPREIVIQNRPQVIHSILTIIAAGLRRNQDINGAEHFRFPSWNRIVRAAYVHGNFGRSVDINGKRIMDGGTWEAFADPVVAQRPGSSVKDAPLELERFASALRAVFGSNQFHAGDIVDKIEGSAAVGGDDGYEAYQKIKSTYIALAESEMPHGRSRTGDVNITPKSVSRLLKGQVNRTGGNFEIRNAGKKRNVHMYYVLTSSEADQGTEEIQDV